MAETPVWMTRVGIPWRTGLIGCTDETSDNPREYILVPVDGSTAAVEDSSKHLDDTGSLTVFASELLFLGNV